MEKEKELLRQILSSNESVFKDYREAHISFFEDSGSYHYTIQLTGRTNPLKWQSSLEPDIAYNIIAEFLRDLGLIIKE